MLYQKFLGEKTQLPDVLSEFVISLKLGFLWWKLKIFISNLKKKEQKKKKQRKTI